jgi:hypothetical protein
MATKAAKKAPAKKIAKGHNSTGESGVLTRLRRIEKATKRLHAMNLIYSYGGGRSGGHISTPVAGQRWTDCSGFATHILDVAGIKLKNDAGSTWSLENEGLPGKGTFLTLFIKEAPGDEHVIVRLRKRPRPWHLGMTKYRWVECGGTDNPDPAGGPSFFTPGSGMGLTPAQRIAEFPIHRHFAELEVNS